LVLLALYAIGTFLIWGARGFPAGAPWIGGGLIVLVYLVSFLVAVFKKRDRVREAPFVMGLLLGTAFGSGLAVIIAVLWGLGCLIWALWKGLDLTVFLAGLWFPLAFGLIVALTMLASFTIHPRPGKDLDEPSSSG
jgi:hypothetical protein